MLGRYRRGEERFNDSLVEYRTGLYSLDTVNAAGIIKWFCANGVIDPDDNITEIETLGRIFLYILHNNSILHIKEVFQTPFCY